MTYHPDIGRRHPRPASILELGGTRHYPAGTTLIAQDSRADRMMVITAGFVTEEHLARDGRRTVTSLYGPGDVIGEPCLLGPDEAVLGAVALTEVVATAIPCGVVRHRLEGADPLLLQLLELLGRRGRRAERTVIETGAASAEQRIDRRILELAERWGRPGAGGIAIPVPLRQRDLADWAGVSLQAAAKALAVLRSRGIVETGRRRVVVRDLNALRERCAR